jgi:DNA-binding winged helix-turn-helix (wHTH) protein/tetratricopeptide (TPR) repeat protein
MDTPVHSSRIYRFGLFEADAYSGQLLRRGSGVKLQDQPFRLLVVLLEHAGAVVSREQLRQQLWPSDTYVEFDGSLNNTLKKLRSALGDTAENPTFVETIPKRGYRFIAPVTVIDPPQTTLQPDLAPESGKSASRSKDGKARTNWRHLILAATVFILVGSGLVSSYHRLPFIRRRNAPLTQPQTKPRPSVAILGFNNASSRPQDAWLSTALSEMLSTELAQGEELRIVSGEDVAQLRLVAPWTQTGTLGQETTVRLGNSLSSDLLVLGSYTSVGRPDHRQLRLDVRLQESVSGNILTEIAETGNEEDLFRLTSAVGNKLHQRLGMASATETEQAGALASLPSNAEAARFYALGLDKLRQFDAVAARDLLEQAIKADPKFPLAHSMLARAWSQLGYEQKRKQEAKAALALSGNLSRTDRMLVEGDYYESIADHGNAASTYQALFTLFPDSVEYGLQLAGVQILSSHASEAHTTLNQLRRLPPPASNDPRIDLTEARCAPNKQAALVLIRNATAKASAQGKKLVYAQARKEEGMDLIYGDHPEQGAAACQDAYKIFLAAGNRLGAADSLRLIGDQQGDAGHREQSIATYQQVLAVLQELGEEHLKTGAVLNNMAVAFANEGKLERAEQLYGQAKFHFEQAGDKHNVAVTVGNIADILYLRGNLPAAANLYEQGIRLEAKLDPSDPGYLMYRLADLKLTQGRVREAHPLAQHAIDILRPQKGAYPSLTSAMLVLGDALRAEADLNGARQQYQLALEMRQTLGETTLAAEAKVTLADLALHENQPQQAESLLRQAIPELEKDQGDPEVISAYVVLSHALLMQGKREEARKAAQHVVPLLQTASDPALKLPAAIQNARLDGAGKGSETLGRERIAAVVRQLRSVAATAKRLGYYQLGCEARLELGELELKNHMPRAHSQLAELAHDAHQHGLELMAHKAEGID